MKFLSLDAKDGTAHVDYDLDKITVINYDLACNVYDEADVVGNGLKPCEMVMIINFVDGSQATFSAANWMMCFI
jgi:hypothetical protein